MGSIRTSVADIAMTRTPLNVTDVVIGATAVARTATKDNMARLYTDFPFSLFLKTGEGLARENRRIRTVSWIR